MDYKLINILIFFSAILLISSCGGGSNPSPEPATQQIPFTQINSTDGFSVEYLNNKTFYSPYHYYGGDYIKTYSFTNTTVSDNYEHTNSVAQTTSYSIVEANNIKGVITYKNNYDLYYSILSVETDHIKVCYNYNNFTGNTAIICDPNQAERWYFDRVTAEKNPNVDIYSINSTDGFSSKYLNNKYFYLAGNYQGNKFITVRTFSNSIATKNDNLFNNGEQQADYTIVSSNGINGVLTYFDGVYNLHYNIHSVASNHIKVCYTYTGIDTVILCDVSQTQAWYFDKATAEQNYP